MLARGVAFVEVKTLGLLDPTTDFKLNPPYIVQL